MSTAFAEATDNQLVSRRFVKKEQMKEPPCGRPLLLQIWTRVLKDELPHPFRCWYSELV
jgi:hypothetical protein